ncbi:protein of unknown function [Desulfocicer vacuolatum DSM 3385]|uniref:IrrE N-terminal-like domain-containing protein n=1 Tax=Desulfocicer vacuolatum DSM 3385 TaxID=1121400 RepID=A0A1W2A3S0_9BACT|nr:ImmA/IrrE family metallo-endopeptidase [Desulfocicer vacuolatum]SMC55314.1 protein of unknown function [Desulfocicer vacuolatum DSM 3385]
MLTISDFKCPYIDKKEIWKVAERFREKYCKGNELPIDIEKVIEDDLGMYIEPEHDLLSEYDIDAYLRFDLTGVVVDYARYMDERFANRLRFSLAHELGHFFLHQDTYKKFGITDLNGWKSFMDRLSERQYSFFEFQANEFAGRALVPKEALATELKKCLVLLKDNGLENLLVQDPSMTLNHISTALCKPFGVSHYVIERRIEREDLWPPR